MRGEQPTFTEKNPLLLPKGFEAPARGAMVADRAAGMTRSRVDVLELAADSLGGTFAVWNLWLAWELDYSR